MRKTITGYFFYFRGRQAAVAAAGRSGVGWSCRGLAGADWWWQAVRAVLVCRTCQAGLAPPGKIYQCYRGHSLCHHCRYQPPLLAGLGPLLVALLQLKSSASH